MQYLRNTDVAKTYNVSLRAVANWITAAKDGKLDIELFKLKEKYFIANTSQNATTIRRLVTERRKYRASHTFKTASPDSRFYEIYPPDQIADIVSSLEVQKEIPFQYNYVGNGAALWGEHVQHLYAEATPTTPVVTSKLLDASRTFMADLLTPYNRINVIDLGPGNALPVRELLADLLKRGALGRYVALDISPEMIELARRNVKQWFGEKVPFEGELRDITYERFKDVTTPTSGSDSVNLILFLGSTRNNFRDPMEALKTIYHSMEASDLLVCSERLDTATARRRFDFEIADGTPTLIPFFRVVLELLGIDKSLYDVENGFNEQANERYIRIRFKTALAISFAYANTTRLVQFNKGDTVMIWRYKHLNLLETLGQFDQAGFDLLQANKIRTGEFVLTVHQVKTITA